MNLKQYRWARCIAFLALVFLFGCTKPNIPPELGKLEPKTSLIFSANSKDITNDPLELSFSISDAEDEVSKLKLSATASDTERIKDIEITCDLDLCTLKAEVDRKQPATIRVDISLIDTRNGQASTSFSVKIEPRFLAEASPVALQTALSEAATGDFLALSANLFPNPAIWLLKEPFLLTKDVTILGPGVDKLKLDAQGLNRHFKIVKGVSATLESMTLSRGFATDDGGQGDFEPLGGAIFNAGRLELRSITISNSQAIKGGAVYNFGPEAVLIIRDSLFGGSDESLANHADRSGGALFNDSGRLELYNTTLHFNTSTERGGAVYNLGKTAFMLADKTEFLNNVSADGGAIKNEAGSLRIQNVSLIKDNVATLVEGGGIFNTNSKVEILDSTLIGNSALKGAGGGIYSFGPEANVKVVGSLISDNFALSGGGIYHEVGSGSLIVNRTTVQKNKAESFGGGIFSGGFTTLSSDSSVVANSADSNQDNVGYGGGVFIVGEDISGIDQSVILNNTPDDFAQPKPEEAALFASLGLKSIKLTRDGE